MDHEKKYLKHYKEKIMKHKFSAEDYAYMNSLSAAVKEQSPRHVRTVLYMWLLAVFLFIGWAYFAEVDEITRGQGEIVPSGNNQMIQNLEGGIVQKIMVKPGDFVEKGQPLMKIDNSKSEAQHDSSMIKSLELEAKIIRLKAESDGLAFEVNATTVERMPLLISNERSLYRGRRDAYRSQVNVLDEQLSQKRSELQEVYGHIRHLKRSLEFVTSEVKMTEPMVKKGVKSRVDFLKLQREQNGISEKYTSAKISVNRIKSSIIEVSNKIEQTRSEFRNKAKQELNEAIGEKMRLRESSKAYKDQVDRTLVRSPIKGIIQKLYIFTEGGVVKPGEDLIEIVPTDEALWVEVKVKPSDIAFIYPGQNAKVKFSAYDFSIYGGLEAEVFHISADTIKDQKENVYYTVHLKTQKNFLGTEEKPLKIIPGMTVDVDIITGKKSVLDYILKPILKSKQYTFTER